MPNNKIGGAEIFLVISACLMIIFSLLYFASPLFAQRLATMTDGVQQYALRHGYWGGLIITFLSNAALLIPIPYGTILFVLGSAGLNPWLLGFVTGMAAGFGEIVSYAIGRGAGHLVSAEQRERFHRIHELIARHPRLVPLLIFFFGMTPIPDDIILLPLGMIKYPFWKAILPDVLGKLVMTISFSLAGKYSLVRMVHALGSEGGFWSGMMIVALTVLAIYFTLKIKWEKLIQG